MGILRALPSFDTKNTFESLKTDTKNEAEIKTAVFLVKFDLLYFLSLQIRMLKMVGITMLGARLCLPDTPCLWHAGLFPFVELRYMEWSPKTFHHALRQHLFIFIWIIT